MFENVQKDILWEHLHSPTAKAINNMYGKVWIKEHPAFINDDGTHWRPPGFQPERGRSPIETRFKREPETIEKDRQALLLRELGHTFVEIADALGMSSRQVAFKAVRRAEEERKKRKIPSNPTVTFPLSYTLA